MRDIKPDIIAAERISKLEVMIDHYEAVISQLTRIIEDRLEATKNEDVQDFAAILLGYLHGVKGIHSQYNCMPNDHYERCEKCKNVIPLKRR